MSDPDCLLLLTLPVIHRLWVWGGGRDGPATYDLLIDLPAIHELHSRWSGQSRLRGSFGWSFPS